MTLASKTGQVTFRQKGDRGMMPYPAGEYSSTVTYVATANTAPYVLLSGTYYVMNKIGSWLGTSTGKTPAEDYADNGNNATWIPFENYKAIYVELLMANFGKIASAVFSGEFMFSQQGKNAAGAATSDYSKFGTSEFTPNLMLNFLTGEASLANGNITFGANGEIVCNKGIFKVGIQKSFREVSLNDYTSESFKANLSQGLNFVFTKNVGNDSHYMTLPNSIDLDGFESEMYFYGNPGSVMISAENGLRPFMYNGMRVKQIKIGDFPRRLSITARKSELFGVNYVEWWITNTSDYSLSDKVSSGVYNLATTVYYNV